MGHISSLLARSPLAPRTHQPHPTTTAACPAPLQLVLPVAPPVALYGARVHEGQLGLKFMRVKQNPWDTGASPLLRLAWQ